MNRSSRIRPKNSSDRTAATVYSASILLTFYCRDWAARRSRQTCGAPPPGAGSVALAQSSHVDAFLHADRAIAFEGLALVFQAEQCSPGAAAEGMQQHLHSLL